MRRNVAPRNDRRDSNGVIHASTLTSESAIAMYLAALQSLKRSENHIRNSRLTLGHVADFIHPHPLLLAEFDQLQQWQNSISRLGAGTVAVYVSNTRSFYSWWVRPMRVLAASPADDLTIPRRPKRRPRPIPEPDYQFAVQCCADEELLVWLFLMRYAGLRCCEIALIRCQNVIDDAAGSRLHIIGKGSKERFVPISAELRAVLTPWLEAPGHMFTHENGKPFFAYEVSKKINNYLHSVGLSQTAHQMRHLFGTDALERSKDIRLVQELMGHESVETTQLYTEVNTANGVALAAELGRDLRKHRHAR